MTDDELIARHDEGVQNVVVGVDYYLGELARRRADRQMEAMLRLTVVIAAATILALATSLAALLVALFD